MATYKSLREAVELLVDGGLTILEVEIAGESTFFSVEGFEPPVGGTVSSAPFLTFDGKDITKYLEVAILNPSNPQMFKEQLEQKYEKVKSTSYKMSDRHIWRFFE